MVRALGLLYIGGPSVAVACQLLPHSPATDETAIWVMAVVAYSMVPVLFTQYRRLPPVAVSAIIALANTLVTAVVFFNHEASSYYAFLYLWVTPYAAIFFSARHLAAHLAYPAVAYAVVLAVHADAGHGTPGDAEIGHWLHVAAAVGVTVLLVRSLTQAIGRHPAQGGDQPPPQRDGDQRRRRAAARRRPPGVRGGRRRGRRGVRRRRARPRPRDHGRPGRARRCHARQPAPGPTGYG